MGVFEMSIGLSFIVLWPYDHISMKILIGDVVIGLQKSTLWQFGYRAMNEWYGKMGMFEMYQIESYGSMAIGL